MNRRGSHFTKADMKRMLEAASEAGFKVAAFEMKPDGTIRIEQSANQSDESKSTDTLKCLILRETMGYETES